MVRVADSISTIYIYIYIYISWISVGWAMGVMKDNIRKNTLKNNYWMAKQSD